MSGELLETSGEGSLHRTHAKHGVARIRAIVDVAVFVLCTLLVLFDHSLSEEEKAPFAEMYEKDKQRYEAEERAWKAKLCEKT